MKKKFILLPAAVLIIYLAGPRIPAPMEGTDLPTVPSDLALLTQMITSREDSVSGLKPDNEARIIWYDSMRRTPYVFVYLHGWSASYMEGDPIHRETARRFGANLYLPRLYGHGIDTGDNFSDMTADKLIRSAKEALAVASQLGDSVIIIGTSTGGTLGLYLANSTPSIAALVLYSPNIRIYDKSASILDNPWGIQLGQLVTGSSYHEWDAEGPRKQYWTNRYRLEALGHLQALIENTMQKDTFEKVEIPVFTACYYRNEDEQDHTVSVEAIVEMHDELGSHKKVLRKLPDVGHHVMASSLTSKDLNAVRAETIRFLEEEAGLKPVSLPPVEESR
jgi:esterase/lipase